MTDYIRLTNQLRTDQLINICVDQLSIGERELIKIP